MRKWLRSISILALLALVVGFVLYDRFWRPAPVEAIEIQPTTLAVELSGTGRLDTHLSAVVSTRIQGRIERIEFDQGDAVSAEQVICRLDDSDLQRQVEISEASVDVARAAITRAEAEATRASAALALAEREAQRIRDAAERSAVSASELDRVVQQAAIAAADAARPKWGGRVAGVCDPCEHVRMITRTLILGAAVVVAASLGLARAEAPAGVPLPAGQDTAEAALAASPRHGEWVDVPMPGVGAGGAPLKTWVVYPERAEKAPVVLVIHEIFGLTDWVRAVADQLAAEGFIAVAPDFLSGLGPDGGGTSSMEVGVVREKIRTLTPADVALRLDAAKDWALQQPAATGKFGCIGFCWGGSQSFNYATVQAALGAAVVCYGTAPTDAAALGRIACPVLGLYGGDDARVTSTVEATTKAMGEAEKSYTPHVYEGAGHGFLRQQAGRDATADAAAKAWGETVVFLRGALGD